MLSAAPYVCHPSAERGASRLGVQISARFLRGLRVFVVFVFNVVIGIGVIVSIRDPRQDFAARRRRTISLIQRNPISRKGSM